MRRVRACMRARACECVPVGNMCASELFPCREDVGDGVINPFPVPRALPGEQRTSVAAVTHNGQYASAHAGLRAPI